jgi:hypothetical protein
MVLLLVVGLAAVIIVILIAVFLSVRLGRSDDREEPPEGPSARGRGRAGTDDSHWQDEGASRQAPAGAARSARSGRPRPEAQDSRPYRDPGDRHPERDQAARPGDYGYPQRRPGRYDSAPVEQPTDPRRPVAAGARRSGSVGNYRGRRGSGRGRPGAPSAPYDGASSAPYDTDPSAPPAVDDFPSGPLHATDFPSGEFPSRPQPAADFRSGGYPPAATAAAEAPAARYRRAGHSDDFSPEPQAADFGSGEFPAADFASGEFPAGDLDSGEFPAADFASGEFPAGDLGSGEFPAADFPSGETPAIRGRGRSAPPKTGPAQDRSDSRRRPAKGSKRQGSPKGRSRQQRKRDDDDWPSMDWDKLTDEQYWEQLSADKPLATTARSSQPASEPEPAPPRNGQSRPAVVRPTPPAPASRPEASVASRPKGSVASRPEPSTAGHARTRGLPGRQAHTSSREAPTQPREVAARREAVTRPHEAAARHEITALPREAAAQPREAASRREAVTQSREAAAERLPVRPRQQPPAARPRNGTPLPVRPDAAATPPEGEPSLAMLARLANGSADSFDDPLTSPSFSRHAPDSRSYGGAGTSGRASDAVQGARADRPPTAPGNGHAAVGYGNGHASRGYGNGAHANGGPDDRTPVNGTYQVSDYADQGYARTPAAPPARSAGAPRPAEWHSAPSHTPAQSTPAQSTPPQGNPYGSYVEPAPAANYPATPSYPATPPLGYRDQSGADFPAYPGERGYQQPAYDPAASLPYSGPPAAGTARLPMHPSGAGQFGAGQRPAPGAHRDAGYAEDGGYRNGYPGQAPYPDSRAAAGYPPGYSAAADQYRHDGYGGHPAGQG